MTDYAAKREPGINPPKSGAFTEVRWIKRLRSVMSVTVRTSYTRAYILYN